MTSGCGQGGFAGSHLIDPGVRSISSERNGTVHTIGLVGELDLGTAYRVEAELKRVEASDAQRIVLDLSRMTFMSSIGVYLLDAAVARSRADANRLTLLRGSPAVQRVLALCSLEDSLPFAD